jgi:PncC family amidohydrolase
MHSYEQSIPAAQGAYATLRAHKKTIAFAESYTGGLLAALFSEIPGSSQVLYGGVCTYATQSKCDVLGIDAQLIADYGVVSEKVALAMAHAVKKLFRADIGIATTGIAGPDGANPHQPVGSVVWAIVHPNSAGTLEETVYSILLAGDRRRIRFDSAQRIFTYLQGLAW